jgi:hypothetical protein
MTARNHVAVLLGKIWFPKEQFTHYHVRIGAELYERWAHPSPSNPIKNLPQVTVHAYRKSDCVH